MFTCMLLMTIIMDVNPMTLISSATRRTTYVGVVIDYAQRNLSLRSEYDSILSVMLIVLPIIQISSSILLYVIISNPA